MSRRTGGCSLVGTAKHRSACAGASEVGQGTDGHGRASRHVILEIGIEEAKNDMMRWSCIESAFGFVPPADLEDYYVGAIAKLEDM